MTHVKNNNWPNEIREHMIEKSGFYQEPVIYQYGFYDGYQKAISSTPSPYGTLEVIDSMIMKYDSIADRCYHSSMPHFAQ